MKTLFIIITFFLMQDLEAQNVKLSKIQIYEKEFKKNHKVFFLVGRKLERGQRKRQWIYIPKELSTKKL